MVRCNYKVLKVYLQKMRAVSWFIPRLKVETKLWTRFFLPLPTSALKIKPELRYKEAYDKMSYGTTNNDFHDVESCLLAYRNMYSSWYLQSEIDDMVGQ